MFRHVFLIFRYMFGDPLPEVPEFDVDRADTDEALKAALEWTGRGEWRAAQSVIEAAGTDWELRGRRVASLGAHAQHHDGWLYAWLAAAPADPTAVLLQAEMLDGRAGKARGGASASDTTEEQFRDFHALSEAAIEVGRRAMALAPPNDPLPWVQMLGAIFGDQQVGPAAIDEIFDEGRRRDPYNFDLHSRALSLRCEKWYGSHEAMFATARDVAAAAPPGAAAVMLPLAAHIEYALYEYAWGEDRKTSLKGARKYFRRPEVQQELDAWIAKWRAGTPGPARLALCRQWEAIFYVLAGRRTAAKAVFDELGQYVSPATAWAYLWKNKQYGYISSWMWANRVR